MKTSEIAILFIVGTLTLLVFFIFVTLIIIEYRRRQVRSITEKLELKHKHEKELIQTQADTERRLLEGEKERLEQEVEARTAEIVEEKKKSDKLLLNILPAHVAEELKAHGDVQAKQFDNVTVLFTDFVSFTTASERLTPQELVAELHACFKAFDGIVSKYNIEKIKTVGDAYLAVAGLPELNANHATDMLNAAMEIRDFMVDRKKQLGNLTFGIRLGLNSGSVVAGIVGVKKFAYDIWGDTVNIAARMEQNSEDGKINITEATYELVKDKFLCSYRGEIAAKNKGMLKMYFVEGKLI